MSKILNIDTATDVCTVAISENSTIRSFRDSADNRSHSTLLAVYIDEVLKESNLSVSELDAIAISMGPGSYTGLRIGVSAAKGLCYGSGKPLIAVSTLQAMCYGIGNSFLQDKGLTDFYFAPMLDARRMEVYTAVYHKNFEVKQEVNACILDENTFRKFLDEKPVVFFGSGAQKFKEIVNHEHAIFMDEYRHSARYMFPIAEMKFANENLEEVAYFEPFYLKDFVTTTPKKNILFPQQK